MLFSLFSPLKGIHLYQILKIYFLMPLPSRELQVREKERGFFKIEVPFFQFYISQLAKCRTHASRKIAWTTLANTKNIMHSTRNGIVKDMSVSFGQIKPFYRNFEQIYTKKSAIYVKTGALQKFYWSLFC